MGPYTIFEIETRLSKGFNGHSKSKVAIDYSNFQKMGGGGRVSADGGMSLFGDKGKGDCGCGVKDQFL